VRVDLKVLLKVRQKDYLMVDVKDISKAGLLVLPSVAEKETSTDSQRVNKKVDWMDYSLVEQKVEMTVD